MSGLSAAPAVVARRPGAQVLDVVLERITYANEESGYTIARVATDRSGTDLVTVVGALLGVQPGESLRLVGRWGSHPRYGRQFEATIPAVYLVAFHRAETALATTSVVSAGQQRRICCQ